MGDHKAGCPIDNHPRATQIAGWLGQGMTSTAVNGKLRAESSDPDNYKPLPQSTLSYHRRLCLGMAKLGRGRGSFDGNTKLADFLSEGEADSTIIGETRKLALALFRHRLKTQPDKIANKDLTPVLTAILRLEGKGGGEDPLDAAMGSAAADAAQGQE